MMTRRQFCMSERGRWVMMVERRPYILHQAREGGSDMTFVNGMDMHRSCHAHGVRHGLERKRSWYKCAESFHGRLEQLALAVKNERAEQQYGSWSAILREEPHPDCG